MQKYVTDFSFYPLSPVKAYILGFAWADGSINAPHNVLAFVSKDDLSPLRDVFYPQGDRPVYRRRKNGIYQLNVCSQRIVQELVEMGFTHQKSKTGMPVVPQGFEQYFLLGLLDGTICSSADKELKVFYWGNRETMNLVQTLAEELVNVRFSLRGASTAKNPIVEGRTLQNNHVCSSIRESQILYGSIITLVVFRVFSASIRNFSIFRIFIESSFPASFVEHW